MNQQIRLLFVCLGNICRSPTAEGIMNHLIKKEGLQGEIICDSAGLHGYHAGEMSDPRTREHALKRGIKLTSIARALNPKYDFDRFDYILAIDDSIYFSLQEKNDDIKFRKKILKICDFCIERKDKEVPDPYNGSEEDFELVLDILQDACQGLLDFLKRNK